VRIAELPTDFADWQGLLDLIRSAFACMDGRIDPPSSAHGLTIGALEAKAQSEIVHLAFDKALAGCVFCKPEPRSLYIGKLAVRPDLQGRGIGRGLIEAATATARAHGLPDLRLQTRIELVENHRAFSAMGFVRTTEGRHPGFDRTTFIEMRKAV
jgi:N-acetylglutamate synthase-like GNAT family acetyltransferase